MDRMKQFCKWALFVVLFYLFTTAITYICLYPEKVGGTIYNITHRVEVVNESK